MKKVPITWTWRYGLLPFIAPHPNPTESGLENILFCKMGCIEKLDVGKLG